MRILSHAAYSTDLAPPGYYLLASIGHTLAEQRFISYENGSMTGSTHKTKIFYGD